MIIFYTRTLNYKYFTNITLLLILEYYFINNFFCYTQHSPQHTTPKECSFQILFIIVKKKIK